MKTVFSNGSEEQILFMLGKLMEINDKRFAQDVEKLLHHPSVKVQTAAIQNLYFLNSDSMSAQVPVLLKQGDEALTLATLQYVLLHAQKKSDLVYDTYLDHPNRQVAENALYCLAQEARDNYSLKHRYRIEDRIREKLGASDNEKDSTVLIRLLKSVGAANIPEFYPYISKHLKNDDPKVVEAAIGAAGNSVYPDFIATLANFLPEKAYRAEATTALRNYGKRIIPALADLLTRREIPISSCRFIPNVIGSFESQDAIRYLLLLLSDTDLSIRLEVVRALSELRRNRPNLKFDRAVVGSVILEECKLYHQTLSAMHTQIIVSYRNRKRSGKEVSDAEREARSSLLELLERRLDAGLERIFKLLGLKYSQRDVEIAYEGLLSKKHEAQANAIDFLDNMLTGDLKRRLLPIIEESSLDVSSEEVLQKIKHRIPTERECFTLLLNGNDFKVKLAVLYLIKQQADPGFTSLVTAFADSGDKKIRTFARDALTVLQGVS